MLSQLLTGATVSACNITIHALVMTLVVRGAQAMAERSFGRSSARLAGIMIVTVLVLMGAHTAEVMVWAAAYRAVDAAPSGTCLVYFSFVNFTTLGYGDVIPVQEWRLLGPITAMNGVLLFGWSTAVIFEVLRRALQK